MIFCKQKLQTVSWSAQDESQDSQEARSVKNESSEVEKLYQFQGAIWLRKRL
jgi:hypothetical protein